MLGSEIGPQYKKRTRRGRADTELIFDSRQEVPDTVLNAILEAWLVQGLVEQFICELGFTRRPIPL